MPHNAIFPCTLHLYAKSQVNLATKLFKVMFSQICIERAFANTLNGDSLNYLNNSFVTSLKENSLFKWRYNCFFILLTDPRVSWILKCDRKIQWKHSKIQWRTGQLQNWKTQQKTELKDTAKKTPQLPAWSKPGLKQFLIPPVLPSATAMVLCRLTDLLKEDRKSMVVSPC